MNSKEIIYRKNVDIICKNNIFFYTILNVDEYKHFLPYVTVRTFIKFAHNIYLYFKLF